jgi:protein-S-isoprenylcysteine O-methyltransferase Ste14
VLFGKRADVAGIIAPPPLLFFLYLGAAWGADALYPLRFEWPDERVRILGGLLAMPVAATVGLCAIWVMVKAKTPVEPWHPTKAIVTEGPFRFTRNPLYFSLAAAFLAITLFVHSAWFYGSVLLLFLTLHYGVVLPEEKYLLAKFGEPYLGYMKRVRRWI